MAMCPEAEDEDLGDPDRFGSAVALYDIQEPTGDVARTLRRDESGVLWWGDLGEPLPRKAAL